MGLIAAVIIAIIVIVSMSLGAYITQPVMYTANLKLVQLSEAPNNPDVMIALLTITHEEVTYVFIQNISALLAESLRVGSFYKSKVKVLSSTVNGTATGVAYINPKYFKPD